MDVKIKNPLTGKLIYKNAVTHKKLIKDKVLDENGNRFEMDIDQIIDENRCWDCKCELYSNSDDENEDEWRCEKCPEIYYSCKLCEDENGGHPVSDDCETLCKGGFCNECKRRFCDHHWQSRTDYIDSDDSIDEILCAECYKKHEFDNEDDIFYWQIQECKCWRCKKDDDGYLVLKPTGEVDELECPKCQKIYYSCVLCEKDNKGNPVSQDVQINDKGQWCNKCCHHFCIAHWQNMENLSVFDDEWYCDDCFSEDEE